jgi:hypothetical protein
MIRGLIEAIVLTPEPPSREGDGSARYGAQGTLRIELRGNLAPTLSAAQQTKRSSASALAALRRDDLFVPIQLVAGACNRRYLQLWNVAS